MNPLLIKHPAGQVLFKLKSCINTSVLCGKQFSSRNTLERFSSLPVLEQFSCRNTLSKSKLYKSKLPVCTVNQKRYLKEDNETKALTIWKDLKHLRHSPKPALLLGLSGLIPFISAPCYLIMSQTYLHHIALAQLMYGATILSFLGGVRWGYVITKDEMLNWFNMCYSVTPPLIAWVGLLFPFPIGLITMISGLAFSAYFDTLLRGYPPWFKALRFTLSFFAVLSLWTTFVCRYLLDSPQEKQAKLNENQNVEIN